MSEFVDAFLDNVGPATANKKHLIRESIFNDKINEEFQSRITKMKYSDFLQTSYWKTITSIVKEDNGNKCLICGRNENLVVHHKTYEHHGLEHLKEIQGSDLICICKHCHGKTHKDQIAEQKLKIFPNQKVIKIIKINNNQDEIDLYANMAARKELSTAAYMLYMELTSNINGYICALSMQHIINSTSLTERTYYKAVNELIEKGYLVKTKHDQIKEYYLFYENGDDEI